ncbi:flavoprotein [Saccharothrix variisporea]|uniref:Flavoprotein n=1 Tax=Saccharothrix variisporea TaxID=543527 RepID=A0A495XCW2_9PSEU|nr:flavoprotein [Saccharothrix variisporea]RKT69378.1 flavoprotein [Saccharothrix variisporea]
MTARRWLYLVCSAAPPVLRIEGMVELLTRAGWEVVLIATPTAASWVDLDTIGTRTGCLVRVAARPPGEDMSLPRADAVVAAPLTFNTINKWAAGFSDSVALGVLNELLSADVPILAAPCVKALLRAHPAYDESITRLTAARVKVLDPDAITGRGPDGLATFDWRFIADELARLTG